MGIIILAVLAALILIYYLWKRSQKGWNKESALREECRRLLRLPPDAADESIDRYIKSLQERHPDHPEKWYLEKIIHDLKRDR